MKSKSILAAKLTKRLFDLCDAMGECCKHKLHIIQTDGSIGLDYLCTSYRVYHADGYCFDVKREEAEVDEKTEINEYIINGFEYTYMEDVYPGFKKLELISAIDLLKKSYDYIPTA